MNMKLYKYCLLLILFFNLSCKTNYSLSQFKEFESTHRINNNDLRRVLSKLINEKKRSSIIIHTIIEEDSIILISSINFESYVKSDKEKVLGYINDYDIPIIISGRNNEKIYKRENKTKVIKILRAKKVNKFNPPIIYEPRYKKYKLLNNKLIYLGNIR